MLIAGGEHDSDDVFLSLFFKHVIVSLFEGNGVFFVFLPLGLLLLFIDLANASMMLVELFAASPSIAALQQFLAC